MRSPRSRRVDDPLWKSILEQTFSHFLQFIFPDADAVFDLNRPFDYLDKEFETKEQLLKGDVRQADLFAIYSSQLKRIHHVGLVKAIDGPMLISVEGNSHDRVESRRRPLTTIYAIANWID